MSNRHTLQITGISLMCLILAGCGPSDEEIATKIAIAVEATEAAIPTMTSYPTLTPYPTLTSTSTPFPTNSRPVPYNIEGRLLWNDEPIQAVEVQLATEGLRPFLTVTDEIGRYTFLVPAGEYRLSYRFPGQDLWTSSQTTPYFSLYRYVEEPIAVEEGKITSLADLHTMKQDDLKIIYPAEPGQKLPSRPTFEWEPYPFADVYQIWIYENSIYSGIPVSVPATNLQGNPGVTRTTALTFDSPLSTSVDYYVWVIAYNANSHELADYRRSFVIAGNP